MKFPLIFPVAIVAEGAVLARFDEAVQFTGPGDVLHPVSAWALWTADDWAALCPGWAVLPLIDSPPSVAGKRAVARPAADWTVSPDAVTVTYQLVDLTPTELAAQGDALKVAVAERVQRHLDVTVAPRNYSSAAAAVSYIGDPNPVWDAEGRAVLSWRSDVWQTCFAALDDVMAGRRAPLTPEEMVAELPPLIWPA